MQTLFEVDFRDFSRERAEEILNRNIMEFAPDMTDKSFVLKLLSSVLDRQGDIDRIIEKAAPDWPLSKISNVDRGILRVGLYELLFADKKEVPPKVAINEAIEIAKTYGGESSGRFVNGVLGSVYKEMGEPGKNESGKKKRDDKFNLPYEKMPVERLGGAVVYAKKDKEYFIALVHDVFGHWTLPKGHIEEGEEDDKGTEREVMEEIGVKIKAEDELGLNEYIASDPEKGKIRKQVKYFLAKGDFGELKLGSTGGLDDVRWFRLQDILELNFYNDILPIMTKAVSLILQKSDKK